MGRPLGILWAPRSAAYCLFYCLFGYVVLVLLCEYGYGDGEVDKDVVGDEGKET